MRAAWLAVAGLVFLGAASPLWAGPFTEVPADHWAYRSCARLTSLGLLASDYQGGFTGDPEITRFEFGIALLDPLSTVGQALASLPADADAEARLRAALTALHIGPRHSEKAIAEAFGDLRRLAVEFADVLRSMGLDSADVSRSLARLADEDRIRAWRLESLARPSPALGLSVVKPGDRIAADTLHVPLAHGTVGLSLTNPQEAPELLDHLAKSASADRTGELASAGPAEAALTDPRISRLRTTYEYGVGSTLTLSLAYEEIARRWQGLAALDAASLTSLGIGYQLTPSTSVKLSYSLLEYSNYALDTPPLRDRVAETAVSIEF